MTDRSFSIDVAALRDRARVNLMDRAVTVSYGQDQRQVWPSDQRHPGTHDRPDHRGRADDDLTAMLRENLAAERIVISTYQGFVRWPVGRHHNETADGAHPQRGGTARQRHPGPAWEPRWRVTARVLPQPVSRP